MKHLPGLGLLSLLALPAAAQSPAAGAKPERVFTLNYAYMEAAEGSAALGYEARRYRLAPDARVDSIFSLEDKRLRRVVRVSYLPGGDTLAATTYWRVDGQRGRQEERVNRQLHGPQRQYGPGGKLQREVVFTRGQEGASTCYDAQASVVACAGASYSEQMPQYPGGMDGLMRMLAMNIRYPGEALRRRAQGKVYVTFIVDETGQPRDVRVKQGVMPALDAEALRVMQLMPRWQPGVQQGQPVPVFYTVPVTFTLR